VAQILPVITKNTSIFHAFPIDIVKKVPIFNDFCKKH